jgi:hypothetical protein
VKLPAASRAHLIRERVMLEAHCNGYPLRREFSPYRRLIERAFGWVGLRRWFCSRMRTSWGWQSSYGSWGVTTFTAALQLFGCDEQCYTQVRAESSLRESEQRWQFCPRGAGDGVWDWNIPDGPGFLFPQWKAMLGSLEHVIAIH